jgi:antitoxin PrlF
MENLAKRGGADEGHAGHRPGSRKERVHKEFNSKGAGKATVKALELGLKKSTPKRWISDWQSGTEQSTLTTKGQVTIPKSIRQHLHVKTGDKVKFFIHPDGTVRLLPTQPISALRGLLKAKRPVTLEEMDEAVAATAVERDKRSRT